MVHLNINFLIVSPSWNLSCCRRYSEVIIHLNGIAYPINPSCPFLQLFPTLFQQDLFNKLIIFPAYFHCVSSYACRYIMLLVTSNAVTSASQWWTRSLHLVLPYSYLLNAIPNSPTPLITAFWRLLDPRLRPTYRFFLGDRLVSTTSFYSFPNFRCCSLPCEVPSNYVPGSSPALSVGRDSL